MLVIDSIFVLMEVTISVSNISRVESMFSLKPYEKINLCMKLLEDIRN